MSKTEWKEYKLGEIYEVHNGLSKGREFFGSGYPFISFSTVFNKWFIPEIITDLAQTTESEQESYSIKAGDILVTRTSETADELGMSCVALKDIPKATYNGFCKRMRQYNKDIDVDPKYVGYYMRNPEFRKNFQAFAGSMSTRASLTNDALLGLTIKLPPLAEQQRIAKILSSLDDKIELNNAINRNLEEQAQAIFKNWFIDFEPFGGEMPEDWKMGTVADIIVSHDSKRIPLSSMQRDSMKKIYPYYGATSCMDYVEDYIFDGIYLLLGEDGTVVDKDGFPILQYVEGKFWVNNHAHILTGKSGYSVEMLYLFFSMTKVQEIVTGAVQLKISQGRLNGLTAIIPNEKTSKAFDEIIQPMFRQIRLIRQQNQNLTILRDTLLTKLMCGEFGV
ncbi:hypothetical protein B7990_08760 [Fibrobacter sp. UWB4]|uniref:restriction endonuclease subunit S n=1 Tax=Fibrobacter sp. UWB4 TaxID=1964356 RepID=UPI000B523ADE|nr:restriction endonuclease subunit S [Fibrobacter sp. UWB4]OWV18004.1 hypothetical protein B7990_08760 [Fibrobacter sp. UWB4]